jgi:hypothetical protein
VALMCIKWAMHVSVSWVSPCMPEAASAYLPFGAHSAQVRRGGLEHAPKQWVSQFACTMLWNQAASNTPAAASAPHEQGENAVHQPASAHSCIYQ